MPYKKVFGGNMYYQGVIDTVIYKSNYYWTDVYFSIKINIKKGIISIVYNTRAYKSKVIHVENYILNLSPIRNNVNDYPRVDNKVSDDCNNVLLYYRFWCSTGIPKNVFVRSNSIPPRTDSVIIYIHSGGTKYRI